MEKDIRDWACRQSLKQFVGDRALHGAIFSCMCGSIFPEKRRFDLRMSDSALCRCCGLAPETSMHTFWDCPDKQQLSEGAPEFAESDEQCSEAFASSDEAYFCRGLLTLDMVEVDTFPPRFTV